MDLSTLITNLKGWLVAAYKSTSMIVESSAASASVRTWCLLGLDTGLTPTDIADYFNRTSLNNTYVERYKPDSTKLKDQYAYVQVEINLVTGFHKTFAVRHKTRLQNYRDDCVMKNYHTQAAIQMGFEKFQAESSTAGNKDNANK